MLRLQNRRNKDSKSSSGGSSKENISPSSIEEAPEPDASRTGVPVVSKKSRPSKKDLRYVSEDTVVPGVEDMCCTCIRAYCSGGFSGEQENHRKIKIFAGGVINCFSMFVHTVLIVFSKGLRLRNRVNWVALVEKSFFPNFSQNMSVPVHSKLSKPF